MTLIVDSDHPQGRPMTAAEQADHDQRAREHAGQAVPRARAALAAQRHAVMSGGVAVKALGFSVRTDDVALGRIGLVAQAIAANMAAPRIPWKSADGAFHDIAAAEVATILEAVAGHVARCFAREAALAAAILGADDPEAVDISTGWPANG